MSSHDKDQAPLQLCNLLSMGVPMAEARKRLRLDEVTPEAAATEATVEAEAATEATPEAGPRGNKPGPKGNKPGPKKQQPADLL